MNFNRRHFLSVSLVLSAAAFISLDGRKVTLFEQKTQVLLALAYHLYPPSPLGFGLNQLHFPSYLAFVLEDERILKKDREYFIKGSGWIEERSLERYKRSFLALNSEEKEVLLQSLVTLEWGYNYVNYLFEYIFEAMFSPPAYGSNLDEIGWRWLGHQAGFPQPQGKEDISYV